MSFRLRRRDCGRPDRRRRICSGRTVPCRCSIRLPRVRAILWWNMGRGCGGAGRVLDLWVRQEEEIESPDAF